MLSDTLLKNASDLTRKVLTYNEKVVLRILSPGVYAVVDENKPAGQNVIWEGKNLTAATQKLQTAHIARLVSALALLFTTTEQNRVWLLAIKALEGSRVPLPGSAPPGTLDALRDMDPEACVISGALNQKNIDTLTVKTACAKDLASWIDIAKGNAT